MDQEEALRIIRAYPDRQRRMDALDRQLRELYAYAPTITAGAVSGMPRGGGVPNPSEAYCMRIESMRESIRDRYMRIVWEAAQVEQALDALTHAARTIVVAREFERLAWEDVAARVGYGERQARRIHGDAIARMTENMSENVRVCPGMSAP